MEQRSDKIGVLITDPSLNLERMNVLNLPNGRKIKII